MNSDNVVNLRNERTYVLSPKIHHHSGHQRENFLNRLHGMLEFDNELGFIGGFIKIQLNMEIQKDTSYPGGDGIVVSIPNCYNGAQLYQALTTNFAVAKEFVVFDPITKEYFGGNPPTGPHLSLVPE